MKKNNNKNGKKKYNPDVINKLQSCFVPMDEEHYTQSFSLDHLIEAKTFFDEYGFVVIDRILTPEEVERTVDEVFNIIEETCEFRRDIPDTWNNWPPNSIEHYGNFSKPSIFTRQFVLNRMNENLYRACSAMIEDEEIMISHDRGCLFRPTVNINFSNGMRNEKNFETKTNLHLDMNPWNYINNSSFCQEELDKLNYNTVNHFIVENNYPIKSEGLSIQGSISLMDNKEEDGGFVTVPGFHKVFEEYFSDKEQTNDNSSFIFKVKDFVQNHKIRISMRAGSIVLWDQRMAHGSTPNRSNQMRSAQFFRAFKKSTVSTKRGKDRKNSLIALLNKIQGPIEMTETSLKVFDLPQNKLEYGHD